jgi:DNA-directed RNA polymerase specialized sigma24 family protein
MPECHKCPHNGKRRRQCLSCPGPSDDNHHGRTHVEFDPELVDHVPARAVDETSPLAAAAAFVNGMMVLDAKTRRVVETRFLHPDQSVAALARSLRVSRQAVHQRLRRAVKAWPRLNELLQMKV